MSKVPRDWKALNFNYDYIMSLGDVKRCFELSQKTVAILLTQTDAIGWRTRWETTGEMTVEQKRQVRDWQDMVETELLKDSDCVDCSEANCIEYKLDASIFTFEPNDPYRTPNLVPDGYAFPPWYLANEATNLLLGTQTGDVVTDILRPTSIPIIPPASGYPRVRINLSGVGIVEMHFVNVNAGGYAQVTVDDDIPSVEFIDLNKDIFSIPPENASEIVLERKFTTTGAHHIDILMIPKINDELLPPVTMGGALRSVVLCGFDEMHQPCEDCEDCEECKDPDDIIDDIIDDLTDGGDLEDLELILDCYRHYPGDIKMSASGQPGVGWLLCDGTYYSKTQYAALYAAIGNTFGEIDLTFAVPDLRGRAPIGAGTGTGLTARTLGDNVGEETHVLTEAELTAHTHTTEDHNHSIDPHHHITAAHGHDADPHTHIADTHSHNSAAHTHTTDAHTHTQNSHNHTQDSHTHVQNAHTHTIPGRENATLGTGGRFAITGVGTVNDTNTTGSTTPTNQSTTATNQAATATNQNATVTVNSTAVSIDPVVVGIGANTVVIEDAAAADTSDVGLDTELASVPVNATGSDEPHNNIQPSLALNFFIFSGCQESGC